MADSTGGDHTQHGSEPADPVVESMIQAVRTGDATTLMALLRERPDLAAAPMPGLGGRTLLHVATDWPGNYPGVADTIAVLVSAGADVNARGPGEPGETALHWAASSDDVAAIDALLDAGADIDAPGAVIGGGTALNDATAFGQWHAAHRLVERAATVSLWDAAALGLMDRLTATDLEAATTDLDELLWAACHGGQAEAAEYLFERGADPRWVGYDDLTAAGAAERSGALELASWLQRRPASTARNERPL